MAAAGSCCWRTSSTCVARSGPPEARAESEVLHALLVEQVLRRRALRRGDREAAGEALRHGALQGRRRWAHRRRRRSTGARRACAHWRPTAEVRCSRAWPRATSSSWSSERWRSSATCSPGRASEAGASLTHGSPSCRSSRGPAAPWWPGGVAQMLGGREGLPAPAWRLAGLVGSAITFLASLRLFASFDPTSTSASSSSSTCPGSRLRHPLPRGHRRHQPAADRAHDVPHAHRAGPGLLERHPAVGEELRLLHALPRDGHARRLRLAEPLPVLSLLGGDADPDVLHHRDLGRARGASMRP